MSNKLLLAARVKAAAGFMLGISSHSSHQRLIAAALPHNKPPTINVHYKTWHERRPVAA